MGTSIGWLGTFVGFLSIRPLSDRMLRRPSGNSISAGLPVVADIEPVAEPHGLVESAEEIAVYCFSLGDCVPRGNG